MLPMRRIVAGEDENGGVAKQKTASERTEIIGQGRWLRLVRKGRWEFVERKNTTGIVAVVAVVRGHLLAIEQFRPAVGASVVDAPAGLAGDLGPESLGTAAARELEEETGYQARRFERLHDVTPSPGLCTEVVTFFRARGLKRVGDGGGDESEDITVHLIPLDRTSRWLRAAEKRGAMLDTKLFTALYFAGR